MFSYLPMVVVTSAAATVNTEKRIRSPQISKTQIMEAQADMSFRWVHM